jgi:hypothetical protein
VSGKAMACNCGDHPAFPRREGDRCVKFRCAGCKFWQPWCCGAADAHPDLCDNCAPTAERAS